MSRCFPFRPTLCAGDGASVVALIETIKIQCEKHMSKTVSSKEKKRVRKEKRKERKEKEGKHHGSDRNLEKLSTGKCYQEEKSLSLFGDQLSKRSEDEEAEYLEKSSVTEEHDGPICYISDGIQSSSKRRRQSSPPSAPSITVYKKIHWIRLPSLKHRETSASLCEGQECFIVGEAGDSLVQQAPVKEQFLMSKRVDDDAKTVLKCLRKGSIAPFDASSSETTLHDQKVTVAEFRKSLTEDWIPPFQAEVSDSNCGDWLFGKMNRSQEFPRLKSSNDVPCRQSSSLWPSACFLPVRSFNVNLYLGKHPRHFCRCRVVSTAKESVQITWDSPCTDFHATNGGVLVIHCILIRSDSKMSCNNIL